MFSQGPALCVAAIVALSACGGAEQGSQSRVAEQQPRSLANQTFLSVSVTENGTEKPLVDGTRIVVNTQRSRRLSWYNATDPYRSPSDAVCNLMGSDLEVTPTKLNVGTVDTTEQACDGELVAQDEWVAEFLAADPNWELTQRRLTLTLESVSMELEPVETQP